MRTLQLSPGGTVMMALGCVVAVAACSLGGPVLSDEVYERCRDRLQTGSAATVEYALGDHPVHAIPECIGGLGLHVAAETEWSLEITEEWVLKPMGVDRDEVRLAIGSPFYLGPDGPRQEDLVPSFIVWALDVEGRSASTYVEDMAPELVQDWDTLGTSYPKIPGKEFVRLGSKLASWQSFGGRDVYVVRWNPEWLDELDEADDSTTVYDMAHYFYPADRVLFWVFRSGVPSDYDLPIEEVLSALPERPTLATKPDRPGWVTEGQMDGARAAVGGLLLFVFALFIIVLNRRHHRRLDAQGIRTTARVVRAEDREGGSLETGSTTVRFVWLEFVDDTGTVRQVEQERDLEIGDELEVVYEPKNPANRRTVRADSDKRAASSLHGCIFVLMGVPGLIFLIAGLLKFAGVWT